MTGPVHFMELRTREGILLQRLDHVSTILENVVPGRGNGPANTVFHLLLANNVKIEVIGETRESLKARMHGAGMQIVVIPLPAEPEPALPVVAEPVGNAVIAVQQPEPEPVA